ncbi:hypothetical protein VTJ83DRAFT_1012 [Remersonia thermophila]|uniref:Guanine nucleotide-exchange factor SEC12 n=1 Tax=Remersonia thermophila TaxID=72144 RepID=A0ABR4DNL1_9PEZI
MAAPIPSAEIRLSYPLYALDFDPQDANRLVVGGGGGGSSRSGVGNKLTVLDASHVDSLQVVSEIDLSRDEDSVNTLVAGPGRRANSILVYAGINSAAEDVEKGNNKHFRVFAADLPAKPTAEGKIAELSRSSLFSVADTDAYQRLLRISGRVGAAATGTIGRPKDAEIAVFDLPAASSSNPAPTLRGKVELSKEAMDMDLLQISDDEHQLVYCDAYDIYTLVIGPSSIRGPHLIFTVPFDHGTGATDRPSFRCIRFLTPGFVLAVANRPKGAGAVLQGFRLPKLADLGKTEKEGKCRLSVATHLPKGIARGTGLAVRNLSPPAAPGAKQDDAQFVAAVTGQDSSITLFTLDHQAVGDVSLIANLFPVTTFKEVHSGPISGVAFSPFAPPPPPPPSSSGDAPPKPVHHLKLATIGSMGNTCVVHRLPLKRLPAPAPSAARSRPEKPAPAAARYVLALKSRKPSARNLFLGIALGVAFLALLLQAVIEVKGFSPPIIGARYVTPSRWHSPGLYYGPDGKYTALAIPSASAAPSSAVPAVEGVLGEYLAAAASAAASAAEGEGEEAKKVVLRPFVEEEATDEGETEPAVVVKVEVEAEADNDETQREPAKGWEELSALQKELWKKALKRAGQWTEEVGEAVFKGVLFGEIGGAVGGAVGAMVA